MSKKENKIENLEDFLKETYNILIKSDNEDKTLIIQNLKNYLISILNDKNEFQNFLKTLDSLIFPNSSNEPSQSIIKEKKLNSEPFLIYKILFTINQKITIDYIDYFLSSLKIFISEENKSNFPFLITIFSEIISSFYNNESNDYINNSIDNEQKENLFQKIFSFLFNNIKIHKKKEQTFLCLLLIEFIEKCPQVKEEKNLCLLFKEISGYLDDKNFECKIELLNCLISLILTTEQKFKPYANVCLFRILDYLTDDDWIKRKLAINIVYTLVFYCKDEIMAVKENIIEFLNILKEDTVSEIREVCLQTLQFFEEKNSKNKIKKEENIIKKIRNQNIINNNKNINFTFNSENNNNFEQIKSDINNSSINKTNFQNKGFMLYQKLIKDKSKTKNAIKLNKSSIQNSIQNKKEKEISKRGSSSTKSFDTSSNTHYKQKQDIINIRNSEDGNITDRNNNISLLINNILGKENSEIFMLKSEKKIKKTIENKTTNNLTKNIKIKTLYKKNLKNQDTNKELRKRFQKEKKLLEDLEIQINKRNPKNSQLNFYANQNTKKKIFKFNNNQKNIKNKKNIYINKIKKDSPKEEKIIFNANKKSENDRIKKYKESIDIPILNNKEENIDKNKSYNDFHREENSNNNFNNLEEKLNKIQESQNNILEMIKDLKNTVDMNYLKLDKRITKLEIYHMGENYRIKDKYLEQIDETFELEIIKNKFKNGKYNEALIKAKEKDIYLIEILSLISHENIHKIDLSIIEEIISNLCLKIQILDKGEGKNIINIILSFFKQIIESKINLKLFIQKNIKNALNLLKNENTLILSQNDKNIIDIILNNFKE